MIVFRFCITPPLHALSWTVPPLTLSIASPYVLSTPHQQGCPSVGEPQQLQPEGEEEHGVPGDLPHHALGHDDLEGADADHLQDASCQLLPGRVEGRVEIIRGVIWSEGGGGGTGGMYGAEVITGV